MSTDQEDGQKKWFFEHYHEAADKLLAFVESDNLSFRDKRVADIGCGDGITDLALVHKRRPAELVGYDIRLTDTRHLLAQATAYGVATELPPALTFRESEPVKIPAADGAFDFAVSWSAFEHIADPVAVAEEMRRILVPGGVLFLQLWPFFHSQHGSHLWRWFPEGFTSLRLAEPDIRQVVMRNPAGGHGEIMLHEYSYLNRITLDDLQRSLLAAGFHIFKVEILSHTIRLTRDLARYPLSLLTLAGVQLLAQAR